MNIREKRLEKNLLQKDVLKDTGLLSKIENGKAIACPEDIERMAKLFECSPRELFSDEEAAYFEDTLSCGKSNSTKAKTADKTVCKPQKKRKCFWIERNTDEVFSDSLKALGFSSAQDWFNEVVEETIYEASGKPETEYTSSDYMGREEIYQ